MNNYHFPPEETWLPHLCYMHLISNLLEGIDFSHQINWVMVFKFSGGHLQNWVSDIIRMKVTFSF